MLSRVRVRRTTDPRERFGGDAVAAKIRICDERRVAVPRHVDLGDDRDVPRSRVGDDVGVLLLGVKAGWRVADRRLAADRREVGPGLDLDAPTLVIGEMEVQSIEFIE